MGLAKHAEETKIAKNREPAVKRAVLKKPAVAARVTSNYSILPQSRHYKGTISSLISSGVNLARLAARMGSNI